MGLTILYQVILYTWPGQLGVWPIVAVGVDGTYGKEGGGTDHSGFAVIDFDRQGVSGT